MEKKYPKKQPHAQMHWDLMVPPPSKLDATAGGVMLEVFVKESDEEKKKK